MLTKEQEAEVVRMKQWFPFRIVYGAIHPETGEFDCAAVTTKRNINKLLREGWTVVIAN